MSRFTELHKHLLCALALLLVLTALPMVLSERYFLGEVIAFLLWASVAVHWNLLMGHAGVFSLGQMLFFAAGSYTVAMLGSYMDVSPWLSIPLGALVAALVALIVGAACLRLAPAYVALLTFAISSMVLTLVVSESECYRNTGGNCLTFWGGTNGFSQFPDFGFRKLLKADWLLGNYFTVVVAFGVSLTSSIIIIHGRLGLAFRAMSDSAIYATSRGISRSKFQLIAFVITAFFTGLTGGVHAAHFRFAGPSSLDFSTTVFLLAMVVVGGLKSTWGPVVGGVFMMSLLETAKSYGDVRNTLLGLVLVCSILLLPKGLVGAGLSCFKVLTRRKADHHHTTEERHAKQASHS